MRKITADEMPAPKPRGNQKYEWDAIFDGATVGDRFAFDKGEDFDCLATSFAVQARDAASERGLSLHIPAVEKDSTTVSVELREPRSTDDESEGTDES